ncbi:MAG: hypothetical protein KDB23_21720 [Planctomycetales bacterium]|nr:hypothetical protein [Planctomycetales bacterium]
MIWKFVRRLMLVAFCCFMLLFGAVVVVFKLATGVPATYASTIEIENAAEKQQHFEQTLLRIANVGLTPEQRYQLRSEPKARDRFAPDVWAALMDELDRGHARTTQKIHQDELNAWLAKELPSMPGEQLVDPRVSFTQDRMTLSARLKSERFSLICSLGLTPHIAPDQLVFDINSLHIGRVPLPIDRIAKLMVGQVGQGHNGTQLDLSTTPPTLTFDLKQKRELKLRVIEAKLRDQELELTVEATETGAVAKN